jgi:cytochrome P450
MVWVMCFLAQNKDMQAHIQDEGAAMGEVDFQAVQNAVKTDSFIREVLRMKGDTASLVRTSIREVSLAGYVIPKGVLC